MYKRQAVVTAALLVVSGLFKAAAHVFLALPDGLMNVMFWIHDIAAALMLVFLAAHVFFAVIAPFSWKTFPSMFTGWMPLSEAEKEHRGWLDRLQREHDERTAGEGSCERTAPATAPDTTMTAAPATGTPGSQRR